LQRQEQFLSDNNTGRKFDLCSYLNKAGEDTKVSKGTCFCFGKWFFSGKEAFFLGWSFFFILDKIEVRPVSPPEPQASISTYTRVKQFQGFT